MNRAVNFKLKNGKIVTIRRIRAADYDACMKYLKKFTRDSGAIWTNQYPNRPKPDKEQSVQMYENPDRLFVGIFDGNNIVGMINIAKQMPTHPYHKGTTAGIGMGMLHEYTHNGLGTKLLQIVEKWARDNGVKMLTAEIRHLNIPSIVNCIKAGFIITGIHHNAAKIKGKWVHEYILEKNLNES